MQESEILEISTCSIFILSYWFLAPYFFFTFSHIIIVNITYLWDWSVLFVSIFFCLIIINYITLIILA